MIPNFDEKGNLPPGVHQATIEEVLKRYSKSGHRGRLARSNALQECIRQVRPFALGLYINGSYITTAIGPNDVDVLVVLPENFDLNSMEAWRLGRMRKQRDTLGVDLYYYKEISQREDIDRLLAVWTQDRDGNPKGVVYVEIRDDQE